MTNKSCVFRFDDVEVREHEFTLIKAGKVLTVEPKAFRVLLFLLHHPQKLIAKEELLNSVWGDTAVTEGSLTRCIWMLRGLLGEDIHNPHYIETVATVGYRFICPVVNEESSASPEVADGRTISGAGEPAPAIIAAEEKPRSWLRRWRSVVIAGSSFIVIPAAALLWYASRPLLPPHISQSTRITNDPRYDKYIRGTDGSRIYLNLWPALLGQVPVSGGEITIIPVEDPSFKGGVTGLIGRVSPNGMSFLFYGQQDSQNQLMDIWVVGTAGSAAHFLTRAEESLYSAEWSPDSSHVIYSTPHGKIYTIPSAGGEPHLIQNLGGSDVLFGFAYSPDGTRVRFNRGDYRIMEMAPDGSNLHEILAGWHRTEAKCCGVWTADGSLFLFFAPGSSETPEVGAFPDDQIWVVDEQRGWLRRPAAEPVQLTFGPMTWTAFAVSSNDGQRIFAKGDTRRGELLRYNRQAKQLEPFLGGMSADMVEFSRDGKSVLYAPFPGGTLLRANRDGTSVQQVISAHTHQEDPRWSPDSGQIAFTYSFPHSPRRIYVVSRQGGAPVRVLPNDQDDEESPTWSPDGKRLAYWTPSAEGETQTELRIVNVSTHEVWYLPRPPKRTSSPRWSPDGRYIICATAPNPTTDGLEIYDFKTQTWRVLLTAVGSGAWPMWSHDSRWVYYLRGNGNQVNRVTIFRISVDGGRPEMIMDLPDFHGTGWYSEWFGLDPDDNPLLLRDAGANEIYALTLEQK